MARLSTNLTFVDAVNEFTHAAPELLMQLRGRFAEPWRKYHDQLHISEMTNHLLAAEREGVKIENGTAACAFVLWHDAIYDPQAVHGQNETLSAELCTAQLAQLVKPHTALCARNAILSTIRHQPLPGYADIPLLLDCDLAILGAGEFRFDRYDTDVRAEYAHVPDEIYHAKRREVLAGFLERERLYLTDWAHERWDRQARENLRRAVGKS